MLTSNYTLKWSFNTKCFIHLTTIYCTKVSFKNLYSGNKILKQYFLLYLINKKLMHGSKG